MIRNIAFALTMLVYIGFPLQMIKGYEDVLSEGEVFRFKPRPIDPFNPFKGRYVSLGYENLTLPQENADELFEYDMPAYVSLKKDAKGFAIPAAIYVQAPKEGVYVQVVITSVYDNEVRFDYPFDEYYMNEEMAPLAETEVRKFSGRDKEEVYIDVRIKDGKAVIEQLYVKGIAIEDFLRQNME